MAVVDAVVDDFPGARARNVDLVSQHDKVVIDAQRRSSRIWSRIVLRARRDGVDRYVMRYFADPGGDMDHIVIEGFGQLPAGIRTSPSTRTGDRRRAPFWTHVARR